MWTRVDLSDGVMVLREGVSGPEWTWSDGIVVVSEVSVDPSGPE